MKITLINWTPRPIETVYWAFMNMHNKIPDDLNKINLSDEEQKEFLEMLMKQPHQTTLEYVETVWLLEGVSRAFQQQLTRTRNAAYCIQSLRIVNVDTFYDEQKYTIPSKIASNGDLIHKYSEAMKYSQEVYKELIKLGATTEDARGVLPLNIHSPITMAINLRDLYHMLELRFCLNTQEEYREVAQQMKEEISKKMHPLFTKPMVPICFKTGKCPSPVHCGVYKFPQSITQDVSRWIKG